MKPKKSEIIRIIRKAVARQQETVDALKATTNPQSVEVRIKAQVRLDTLNDVLLALTIGETTFLRTYAGE